MNKLMAIAGFISLGLSPSFIDWQQSEGNKRGQILLYYIVSIALIYGGLWGYDNEK